MPPSRAKSCSARSDAAGRFVRKVENAANSASTEPQSTSARLTSVVIVAADSGDDVMSCVEHALGSSMTVEVIISDNASSDGSIEKVAARWGGDARVRILRNGSNLGFGAGCNRGVRGAHGDAVLLLNPDCTLEADSLARLRAHLASDSTLGLLGARIVGADGRDEPANRRRDPTFKRALMQMSGLARFEPRWPAFAGGNMPPSSNAPALERVEAVSGALMLLPRHVFEQVGGFDEGYFLHCEDLDLCRRVRDAGLQVACANDVRVLHGKGTSSRRRPFFVARHKHRGMWRWFVKFDPAAHNLLLRALVGAGLWLHFLLMAPRYIWTLLRR